MIKKVVFLLYDIEVRYVQLYIKIARNQIERRMKHRSNIHAPYIGLCGNGVRNWSS